MKKFFTFIMLIIALSISTQSYATDPGFYIGIGGSIAHEEFDIDSGVSAWLSDYGANDEFSNTGGINLKIGYRVNDISSWELTFDHLPGFSWSDKRNRSYMSWLSNEKFEAEVNITTLMLVSKIAPNFGSDTIRPFIAVGVGLMHSELEVSVSQNTTSIYGDTSYEDSISEYSINPCFKIGTGVDFFVKDNVSLGFEVAYVLGTGSLSLLGQEIIDECKYMNYTFGVAYYF